MKKAFFLILISFWAKWSYSQHDTISSQIEFKKFVNKCIDSLVEKDFVRFSSIAGIVLEINLKGELKKYDLTFRNNENKLTRRSYRWLLRLLVQKNYKNICVSLYSSEQLKKAKLLKLSMKYTRGK